MGRPRMWKDPVRKLITLERSQWDKLEGISERKGITVLQLIRRWVDTQRS
jgi:predicted DNA-binding ribbon-helix-helix protein